MAEKIPVCDVLCDAMEYLVKLGSNLRARSENLKQKKINKKILTNTHAVQKAANKVLMICELSKKSLENVETGMKGILAMVDTSQASISDGAKITKFDKSEKIYKSHNETTYYYFVHDSQKLKIRHKVPYKHYTSAKVMARRMSNSMQEKYPIYHNCKLYRLRRKKSVEEINECKKVEKNDNNMSQDVECDNSKCSNIEAKNFPDTENETSLERNNSHKMCERSKNEDIGSDDETTNKQVSMSDMDNANQNKSSDSNIKSSKNLSHEKTKHSSEEKSKYSSKEKSIKTFEKTDKSPDKNQKKLKHIRFIDSSDSNDDNRSMDTINNHIDIENKLELHSNASKDEELHSSTLNESVILTESKKTVVTKTLNKEEHSEKSDINDNNSDTKKPLIKCVSLSKLLKPDVLQTIGNSITSSVRKKSYVNIKTSNKLKEKDGDREYWEQKRIEVSAFEPKQFAIKIVKLPEFSESFLADNNLKIITSNGNIVLEVECEKENSTATNNHEEATSLKEVDSSDIFTPHSTLKEAKSALLNDSDSDKNEQSITKKSLIDENKKIKTALLNDSESDTTEKSNKPQLSKNDNVVESDNHKSNLDVIPKENIVQDAEQILVKDSLLIDSDNDITDKPNKTQLYENVVTKSKSNKTTTEVVQGGSADQDENLYSHTADNLCKFNELSEKQNDECEKCEPEKNENKELQTTNTKDLNQSDGKNDQDETNKESEKIKFSLLHDSSDSNHNASGDKEKSNTPKSKRKHIMESMHAKKMLLTHSSSSDTEDEKLRDALKEIKNSLLQEIYKNKQQTKLVEKRNAFSSSDSEEDISSRPRKKRKIHHKSSSSEREQTNKTSNSKDKEEINNQNKSNDEMVCSVVEQSDSPVKKMGRSREKPGSSSNPSSDNQDTSDKDIDGLTNLNTLHKKSKRRDSPSSEKAVTTRSKKKMPKVMPIDEKQLLEADSSSGASQPDPDVEDEDFPPVTMSTMNGGGVPHLAKDDLLGDTDSSSANEESNNESQEVKKEEDSDTAEDIKSKRRKANAISSDSEAGSSRKKGKDGRVSDFEDSEDESSEVGGKKKKRKKKESDSDDAGNSSNEDGKKKRRRIKQPDSDASGSDSDDNDGDGKKHGRKNIRRVMGKDQLEEATKKAARQEKERLARIAERQKTYNNVAFDESGKPDEVVLDKVVLDFDPETKEPLIQVDRGLVKKLKPHQANGIKFMWDACFESVKRIKKDKGSGCILAHCMGLGKTLQVVALTHTLLCHNSLTGVNRVLVVCPLSTVLNWVNEFNMWLKHAEEDTEVDVYELSRYKQNSERAYQLSQWFEGGGVCVLGYEMFRNLSADNNKKFKKKMLKNFQESLVDPGPDLVVCDEGHLLKNEKTSLSQSMNRVKTYRRIVLTGTPLQNNLKEYYCMVQFVKPNLLGKYNEYLNRFVNPITNGQYTDSTEHDIRIMKRRSHVLHKMLDGSVQRRDYGVLAPFLPPKHEYVLFITLTDVQIKLYEHYLENYSRRPLAGKSSGFLFPDFQSMQRIWTHPLVLKYNSERYEIMQQKKRDKEEEDSEGSLADFIDDESTPDESSTEESTEDSSVCSDDSRKKNKKKKSKKSKAKPRRGTRANPVEVIEEEKVYSDVEEVKRDENPTEWWIKLVTEDELEDLRNSHKLVLLFDILKQCEIIGDKLLVFSQSLYSLDLIEHFLGKVDEATQEGRVDEKLGGHVGSWSPGIDYFRLDGSTSCENRSIWCKNFNREDNPRARLFLISTRAGGLGINLVAANRVVIFDVSWNPSHDVQSIFRVYRFGQKKPCYVYRFLAMGTMEEKIYERQVTKQAISKRVIDEQQIDRHYAENDLAELYKFEPKPTEPRPLPALPKDRLFAEMLMEHEQQIYKFHEHDSLLENKEEETLTEEERKAAWEDFENEKNRPPPVPFANTWPLHNGIAPGLLAQQQKQLMFAAMTQMLRKEMPHMTDEQLRTFVPMVYNANPAVMQKLGEVYNFPQQGMMNPMLSAVMNPASGSVGGSSGLQYEPPWQRQQQQQQQLRYQQMMQQQNMGAKYYAGGLGSRDPMAMAMQHQRAREMQMGDRGRPRGRPPMQPRAPPTQSTAPGDVVDLDSD